MKNLLFVLVAASVLIACDNKEEAIVYPTMKESVEFNIDMPAFEENEVLSVASSQSNLKSVVADENVSVNLNDIWLEVKPQDDNYANIIKMNVSIVNHDGNKIPLAVNMTVPLEENITIVPLMKVLTNEGAQELIDQLSDGIARGNNDIELSVEGRSFFKDGLNGEVNVKMEMLVRYSL